MIKVEHISADQVYEMLGGELTNELWMNGLMNEIRRYPNEIPCEEGEIPSMIIPSAGGKGKVEWGFTAGMSCLIPGEDGSITVRRPGHFPACACLALLSLLYEAGAAGGKKISLKLIVPDDPESADFLRYLTAIQDQMKNISVDVIPGAAEVKKAPEEIRNVIDPSNKIAVAQRLQSIDVGRFAVLVECLNGEFSLGDDVTVADGAGHVLQTHCPVRTITDAKGMKPAQSSAPFGRNPFWITVAMWLPVGTVLNGMLLVKEAVPPVFIPEQMPARPSIS